MKTRLLGFAVILVALAFIVNALALTSANITGTTLSANIVNSSAALIAVVSGSPQDADVSFTDGANAAIAIEDGIQANSTYVFGQVFGVKNNSAEAVWVDVSHAAGSGATITLTNSVGGGNTNIPLASGDTVYFTMSVTAGNIGASSTAFTITVAADKSGL